MHHPVIQDVLQHNPRPQHHPVPARTIAKITRRFAADKPDHAAITIDNSASTSSSSPPPRPTLFGSY